MTMSMLPPRTKAPSPRGEGARHSIQSVDRAVFLLETIAALGGEASLTELAGRTGLNISTCHHLLATLIKRGLAAKVPGKRLYTMGTRILSLGHAFLKVDLPRPRHNSDIRSSAEFGWVRHKIWELLQNSPPEAKVHSQSLPVADAISPTAAL